MATGAVALQFCGRYGRLLHSALPERGVEDRPEVDEPPEKDDPEDRGEEELNDCHQQPALNQLPETRDKETAESRDDVAGGTLTCHGK